MVGTSFKLGARDIGHVISIFSQIVVLTMNNWRFVAVK